MQKGFAPVLIILVFLVIGLTIVGGSFAIKQFVSQNSKAPQATSIEPLPSINPSVNTKLLSLMAQGASESVLFNELYKEDEPRKSLVNHINALIQEYYSESGRYPKILSELNSEYNISEDENKIMSSEPFYYETDGVSYQFYTILNNNEKFKGDQNEINKHIDAKVWNDVRQLSTMINLFYAAQNRLPKSWDELQTDPSWNLHKLPKDPYTKQPYIYQPYSNGRGFVVSGKVSSGEDYKQDINFDN